MSKRKAHASVTSPVKESVEPEQLAPTLLDETLGYSLRRAQLQVFQHFTATMAAHDIRPAQFSALVVVEANPGVTQSALAQALGIDPPRVVNLIHKLEERGLALRVRCKRDRRSHGIFLTKSGETLLAELKRLALDSDRRATASLSDEERAQLLALLQKVY